MLHSKDRIPGDHDKDLDFVSQNLLGVGLAARASASELRAGGYTLTTLHSFKDVDDKHPGAELTLDAAGNIHGTTYYGGEHRRGAVFRLSPNDAPPRPFPDPPAS